MHTYSGHTTGRDFFTGHEIFYILPSTTASKVER